MAIINGGIENETLTGLDNADFIQGKEGNDKLLGIDGNDLLFGGEGQDTLLGNDGDDVLFGNDGIDTLYGGKGNDILFGGEGNDVIRSYADAGEPNIAQDPNTLKVNPNEPLLNANDTLVGGLGADKFVFFPLLNAKQEILERHTNNNGVIDWKGVAGENDNPHDHWVESIGDETILDYNKSEGDQIRIFGHTANASVEQTVDEAGIAYSLITITSNQVINNGAHDGDHLGTISVYGDVVEQGDLFVNPGVFYGVG